MASYNTFDPAYNGIYKVLFFYNHLNHFLQIEFWRLQWNIRAKENHLKYVNHLINEQMKATFYEINKTSLS